MISKSPPVRRPPDPAWEHYTLYERVREAIFAVPGNFRSNVVIRGIQATDLFNLNALLGAAIEEGVVDTLNSLRQLWDSGERYAMYSFVRQPQTFPDVRLQNAADPSDVLLGIELKGWYLLAKEKEPSFRFLATPAVCDHPDLFVVYPWCLSDVISGTPQLTVPYVELARYLAEYRNYHWEFAMRHKKSAGITLSSVGHPYPTKTDEISDKAKEDAGRNFGRIARTGIMDDFTNRAGNRLLSGIEARHWRSFLKIFTETANEAHIEVALARLEEHVEKASIQQQEIENVRTVVDTLANMLWPRPDTPR